VITSIGRDHEKLFGFSDIPSIAKTKAGIMRSGVPVVIAEQIEPEALKVLVSEAKIKGARSCVAGLDWSDNLDGLSYSFSNSYGDIRAPWLGLPGEHQRANRSTARAALQQLKLNAIEADDMSAGLRSAVWPARMQALKPGPVTNRIGTTVRIDGAHNSAAARALAKSIAAEQRDTKPVMILAIQANKDIEGVIDAFAPVVQSFIMTRLPDDAGQEGGSGAEPSLLLDIALKKKCHAVSAPDLEAAFQMASDLSPDEVFICGSLYMAGAVLKLNHEQVE
jgi:dihydrofolate synthase/folylpolyglutamate synthase